MSKIPTVQSSSIISVATAYDREGIPYVTSMMDEMLKKQRLLTHEICTLLNYIDELLTNVVDDNIREDVVENVGYRMFAILKSLYIQNEVDDLEEQFNNEKI